jgi:hypothetical protein
MGAVFRNIVILSLVVLSNICVGLESSNCVEVVSENIVGYKRFVIKPCGVTRLDVMFGAVNGGFLPLDQLLPKEPADYGLFGLIEGDVLHYYKLKSTNILFSAEARKLSDGLHLFCKNTGKCVDKMLLPVTQGFNGEGVSNSDLRIIVKRKGNVETRLTMAGEVRNVIRNPTEQDVNSNRDLINWLRIEILSTLNILDERISEFTDPVVDLLYIREGLIKRENGIVENRLFPLKFYVEYKFDGRFEEITFNPIKGIFTNIRGLEVVLSTKLINRISTIEDEYTKNVLPHNERLPKKCVDKLNELLGLGFFDYKEMFWIVLDDDTTRLVKMVDRTNAVILDVYTGIRYNLERDDIVGFSAYPNKDNKEVLRPQIYGNGCYLSSSEAKELERLILPKKTSAPFWSLIGLLGWLVQAVAQTLLDSKIKDLMAKKGQRWNTCVRSIMFLVTGWGIVLIIWGWCKKRFGKRRCNRN